MLGGSLRSLNRKFSEVITKEAGKLASFVVDLYSNVCYNSGS